MVIMTTMIDIVITAITPTTPVYHSVFIIILMAVDLIVMHLV